MTGKHIKDITVNNNPVQNTDWLVVSNGTDAQSYKQTVQNCFTATTGVSNHSNFTIPTIVDNNIIKQSRVEQIYNQSIVNQTDYNFMNSQIVGNGKLVKYTQNTVGVRTDNLSSSYRIPLTNFNEFQSVKSGSWTIIIAMESNPVIQAGDIVYLLISLSGSTTSRIAFTQAMNTGDISCGFTDDNNISLACPAILNATRIKLKRIALVVDRKQDGNTTISLYTNNELHWQHTLATNLFKLENIDESVFYITAGTLLNNIKSQQLFNYALSTADIDYYWNNGKPHLAQIPLNQKWANNVQLSPSQLRKGYRYKITNNTNSNFTLYGAQNNNINTQFTCNNDIYISNNNGKAILLGAVLSLSPKGIRVNSSNEVTSWWSDQRVQTGKDVLTASVTSNPQAVVIQPVLDIGNTAVAIDLKTGTKKSTAVKVAGYLANSISFNFAFKHQSPSVTTARVIANLLLGTDIVKPVLTLTANELVIRDFATVGDADTTGVTIATRTLTVGKIYNYVLKYSGDTDGAGIIELYENNIPIYKNTSITYNAEYIASVLANVALEIALEEQWIRKDVFNYALTPAEVSLLWNNGRPDRAVLPEYMKWGNADVLNGIGNPFVSTGTNLLAGWNVGSNVTTSVSGGILTFNSSTGQSGVATGRISNIQKWNASKLFNVYIKAKMKSTSAGNLWILHQSDTGYIEAKRYNITNEWSEVVVEYSPASNNMTTLYLSGTAGRDIEIEYIKAIQLGSVASYTAKGLITDSAGKCTSWETDKKIETGTDDGLTATITGSPKIDRIKAQYANQQYIRFNYVINSTGTTDLHTNLIHGYTIDSVIAQRTSGTATGDGKVNNQIGAITTDTPIAAYDSTNLQNNLYTFNFTSYKTTGLYSITLPNGNYNVTTIFRRNS